MLASRADAQGAGSLGGSAAARCRRDPGGGLGALLGGVVGRAAGVDRRRRAGGRDGGGRRRPGGPAAALVLARGGGRARLLRGVRRLERGLGDLVDRGRPLMGVLQPRARLPRVRRGRALARPVGAGVGVRAGRCARAAARLGAAREGDSGARLVRARGAAELADRVLERARPAVRDGAAARPVAGGAAGAPALAARGRRGLPLRAGRRAAADLFAGRRARGGGGRRVVARARLAAGRERGGAAARRRRRARGRGLGVLASGALLGRAAAFGARPRRCLVRGRLRARAPSPWRRWPTSARSPRSGGR